ncbi:hypothetical protein BaRGS_00010123 [Batillaria attramentaria]|uniref:Lipocalin/cytosolic fatty-acid binding domain-containing protein n=1 Tax=Batillaria attramentaria TaxID=370345 RepID=A0ABD0LGV0_9CAEN
MRQQGNKDTIKMKLTTDLKMMLAAMMAVMLQLDVAVAGGGEDSCRIPPTGLTMTNFNNHHFLGQWYSMYKSHIPPYSAGQLTAYFEFTPLDTGVGHVMSGTYTQVRTSNGVCTRLTKPLSGRHGVLTTKLTPYGQENIYILDTDYAEIAAVYFDVFLPNAAHWKDASHVAIFVRDPFQTPNLTKVARSLEKVCGPAATKWSFFDKMNFTLGTPCQL